MTLLERILHKSIEVDATGIRISSDRPVIFIVSKGNIPHQQMVTTRADVEEIINEIYKTTGAVSRLYEPQELDTSYEFVIRRGYQKEHSFRFRVNIFLAESEPVIVFRRLKTVTLEPLELGIQKEVIDVINSVSYGLFVVAGATGSGKSTTLASILNYLMLRDPIAVVTVEDPVEYKLLHGQSWCVQREVGTDTPSYLSALRAVLRQQPNVVLIGEVRDPETAMATIQVAKTGHKVFTTLHTNQVNLVASRISAMFEPEKQSWILSELKEILVGVLIQTLVPNKAGNGKVLCTEFLDARELRIRDLLCSERAIEIRKLLRKDHEDHGWILNQQLIEKYQQGIIREEALSAYTNNIEELQEMVLQINNKSANDSEFLKVIKSLEN